MSNLSVVLETGSFSCFCCSERDLPCHVAHVWCLVPCLVVFFTTDVLRFFVCDAEVTCWGGS